MEKDTRINAVRPKVAAAREMISQLTLEGTTTMVWFFQNPGNTQLGR